MPLINVVTHGSLEVPGSLRQGDIRFLSSAKARPKMYRIMQKIPVPVELHFINLPNPIDIGPHIRGETDAIGARSPEEMKLLYAVDMEEDPSILKIVFVENDGGKREDLLPLTPWIVVHRISHAFCQQTCPASADANIVWGMFESVLRYTSNMYSIDQTCSYHLKTNGMYDHMFRLAPCFGTTRACRQYNLSQLGEWLHECFAQFCVTGAVRFASARETFVFNDPPYKFSLIFKPTASRLEMIDQCFTKIAADMMAAFDRWLHNSVGKIIVL